MAGDVAVLVDELLEAECTGRANVASFRLADLMNHHCPPYIRQNMMPLVHSAVRLLIEEPSLPRKDNHAYFITTLRYAVDDEDKAEMNLMLLAVTQDLLPVFRECYEEDPNGYTAPELVSMWSSIVSEEGAGICKPYMRGVIETVLPCVRGDTVGSIVAALLVANLGFIPSRTDVLKGCISKMRAAFSAAFSGLEYAERQWGPGPVTKALSFLTATSQLVRDVILADPEWLNQIVQILSKPFGRWPVQGFTPLYWTGARASAAKVLYNLALKVDLVEECCKAGAPSVIKALTTCLEEAGTHTFVRTAAELALYQTVLSSFKGGSSIPSIPTCDSPGRVCIIGYSSKTSAQAAETLATTLRDSYSVPCTVLARRDKTGVISEDMAAQIGACAALVLTVDDAAKKCAVCSDICGYAQALGRVVVVVSGGRCRLKPLPDAVECIPHVVMSDAAACQPILLAVGPALERAGAAGTAGGLSDPHTDTDTGNPSLWSY